MELILVRHGESEADILNVIEGRADFPLTQKGRNQAAQLKTWLEDHETINVVYASTLKRARQTAEILFQDFEGAICYEDLLMEWDNGLLAGLPKAEADERYPLPIGGRKLHHTFAETESMIAFRGRAEHFISQLKEKHDQRDKICLVSHGGMINMLLRAILQLPMNLNVAFACQDTCVHKLRVYEDKVDVIYLNSRAHLKAR